MAVSISYLRPFFHVPLINYVLSAVADKRSLGFFGNVYLSDGTSLRTLKLRICPGVLVIPELPMRPPPAPFHTILSTNNDRNYLRRLSLHECVGR